MYFGSAGFPGVIIMPVSMHNALLHANAQNASFRWNAIKCKVTGSLAHVCSPKAPAVLSWSSSYKLYS